MKKITDRTDFGMGTTAQITVLAHALQAIEEIAIQVIDNPHEDPTVGLEDIEQLCSAVHRHLSQIKEDYRIASREQMIAMDEQWTDKHDDEQFDLLEDLILERV